MPVVEAKVPQATKFEIAAGEQNTDATFAEDRRLPGYSRLLTASDKDVETYQVQVRRLDDVLADIGKIDLIKLDIQGAELSALKGAKTLISKWQPLIIFECGQEYGAAEAGYDRKLLYDYLVEIGYSVSTPVDFFFGKEPMSFSEFKKSGLYPFTAMNFIGAPQTTAREAPRIVTNDPTSATALVSALTFQIKGCIQALVEAQTGRPIQYAPHS
jgi:hypothetical protein